MFNKDVFDKLLNGYFMILVDLTQNKNLSLDQFVDIREKSFFRNLVYLMELSVKFNKVYKPKQQYPNFYQIQVSYIS